MVATTSLFAGSMRVTRVPAAAVWSVTPVTQTASSVAATLSDTTP